MAARILYHGYWDHTVAALLKRTPALTCYSISRALETTLPAPPSYPRLLRWTPFGGCHSLSQSRSCVSTRHYSSLCSRNLAVPPWGSSSAKTFPPYSLLPTRNYISHSTYSNHLTYCARGYLHDPLSGVASQTRTYASRSNPWKAANRSTTTYIIALSIAVLGLAYAAVPLYRLFCQASGYGGTVLVADASEKIENMQPLRERELTIEFNSDTSAAMQWQFKPQQRAIKLVPGETALAFYTARNPTDKPVTGIATYNVIPFEAGPYFNKIQCFCFEEQRLNPNEQVDMPVFFYIDPEINEDPAMAKVDTIILSYTFFEAKEGESIYLPVPKQTL